MSSFQKNIVQTDKAPAAVGTYSQGVEHNGVFYFSGQIGIDPKTSTLVEGFQAQMDQILKNIDGLLESCSITREHIIKTSIFVENYRGGEKSISGEGGVLRPLCPTKNPCSIRV